MNFQFKEKEEYLKMFVENNNVLNKIPNNLSNPNSYFFKEKFFPSNMPEIDLSYFENYKTTFDVDQYIVKNRPEEAERHFEEFFRKSSLSFEHQFFFNKKSGVEQLLLEENIKNIDALNLSQAISFYEGKLECNFDFISRNSEGFFESRGYVWCIDIVKSQIHTSINDIEIEFGDAKDGLVKRINFSLKFKTIVPNPEYIILFKCHD